MAKCYSMMVKCLNDHTLISPSLTSIWSSLTSILPLLDHLTIIEKLHRLYRFYYSLHHQNCSFGVHSFNVQLWPEKTYRTRTRTWSISPRENGKVHYLVSIYPVHFVFIKHPLAPLPRRFKYSLQNPLKSGGLNHLPYLLSFFVSLAAIKDFSTNYMAALGLKQAYTSLKLRYKYNVVLICSFRSITGNILQL